LRQYFTFYCSGAVKTNYFFGGAANDNQNFMKCFSQIILSRRRTKITMKKITILLSLIIGLVIQNFAQTTAVSFKQEAWDLGNNLSLAALFNAQGGDSGVLNRTFAKADASAKKLGITLPGLPARKGNKIEDNAEALVYLLHKTGAPIMKILGQDLGAEYAATYEIAFKTNLLLLLYSPDGQETQTIVNVVNRQLPTAKLPKSSMERLFQLISGRAAYSEIKAEILTIQEINSKYLAMSEFSDRGQIYYEQKEYLKSAQEFTKALQYSPEEPQYYFFRGRAFLALGKNSEAINDYTKVIQFATSALEKSNLPTVYHNRGLAYGLLKKNALAIADLTAAIKLRPDYASAYKIRGLVYQQMGNLKSAKADLMTAESLEPGITAK
jgi:tetratricopeptide (TPR) repeat protein